MGDVVWWEIETPGPERFQEFHGSLWGWRFEAAFAGTELNADYWLIKANGASVGGLQRSAASTPPHAGVRLYLEVGGLEATLAQVTALGGRVERGRAALGGADRWFAVIRDPGGISFGLWTPNPASAWRCSALPPRPAGSGAPALTCGTCSRTCRSRAGTTSGCAPPAVWSGTAPGSWPPAPACGPTTSG